MLGSLQAPPIIHHEGMYVCLYSLGGGTPRITVYHDWLASWCVDEIIQLEYKWCSPNLVTDLHPHFQSVI